eukprot:CAMPEP_0185034084 /NCGR_PEP_ID=MMETSP1103-20130426/23630_1 /TAXON_ID=36769 /ORGANISM="Paraphysomonas bandaiensis, Strain Caron Lab Isolate" /LENGTH=684 /DNA_ID=CAMNT_0027570597 /DNA_START=95 /DNA_END=2149 /DNA_ORIENTATION=+
MGFTRLFSQRSMDHRGTTAFPGYVATLVNDSHLKSIGYLEPSAPPSECVGNVFLVPESEAEKLIEELDFREKGGYHRHIIPVKFLRATPHHKKGETADALVYTGSTCNPNFSLDVNDSSWMDKVIEIISAATGPSGDDAQYVLNLAAYVQSQGVTDSYLFDISRGVLRRMCSWRARRLLLAVRELTDNDGVQSDADELAYRESGQIFGWGSNESMQLGTPAEGETDRVFCARLLEGVSLPISYPRGISLPHGGRQVYAGGGRSGCQVGDRLFMWGEELLRPSTGCWEWIWRADGKGVLSITQISPHKVMRSEENGKGIVVVEGVLSAAFGHGHILILRLDGSMIAVGDDSKGQCSGGSCGSLNMSLDHETGANSPASSGLPCILKLSAGLWHSAAIVSGHLFTWGDDESSRVLNAPWVAPDISYNIDVDGENCSSKHCGVVPTVVDVACGAKHTVVIDSIGRVFTFGDNGFGQLGRPLQDGGDVKGKRGKRVCPYPTEIQWRIDAELDPRQVRWQKVTCGWSHSIIKGVSLDGVPVFAGWGRADMGQLPVCPSNIVNERKSVPFPSLLTTPVFDMGGELAEVWCGSEFTLGCSNRGELWGVGWSEHGNLSCGRDIQENGTILQHHNNWVRTGMLLSPEEENQPEVCSSSSSVSTVNTHKVKVWQGSVACGGAHCIAIYGCIGNI